MLLFFIRISIMVLFAVSYTHLHGDYLIPTLTLPEEEEQRVVGVWGQRHLRYLKEYHRALYLNMLTSGRLNGYLADIEEQAQERFERLVEQMKQAQGKMCIRDRLCSALFWIRIYYMVI